MADPTILRLGNPKLYDVCAPVSKNELKNLRPVIQELRESLKAFREENGFGRAISAPEIGIMKRIIYLEVDQPGIFINPVIFQKSPDTMTRWESCICSPDLLVRIQRPRACKITFRDEEWNKRTEILEGKISGLLQHQCDHLFGILPISKAVGSRSFAFRSESDFINEPIINI